MGVLAKPVILLPFAMVYPRAPIKNMSFIPPQILFYCLGCLIPLTMATVVHLLVYRYLTARGVSHFPVSHIIFLIVLYISFPYPTYAIMYLTSDPMEELSLLMKKYTCITPAFAHIPQITIVSREKLAVLIIPWIMMIVTVYPITCLCLIYKTKKALHHEGISNKTKQLQQKLLTQLILQAAVPMVVMLIPSSLIVYVLVFEIFLGLWISASLYDTVAIFGVSSGIILILTSSCYNSPIRTVFCMKQKTSAVVMLASPNIAKT